MPPADSECELAAFRLSYARVGMRAATALAKGTQIMTHGILSTLSIAVFGILAARAGDRLYIPFVRRKPCDETSSKGAAWRYKAEAAQGERTWLPIRSDRTC